VSSIRVVLIAEEAAGTRVLRLLENAPSVTVEAVFAAPDRRDRMGSVWASAERAGHRLLPADRVRDPETAAELADRNLDLVLNVHSLYIIHPALLELPRLGAYNLHPGPLPEMAGLNVPSWAILLGHQHHGVTLHQMTAGIDEGAIAFEDRFAVPAGATGLTLSLECVRRGVPLIARLLETVERGEPIPARSQDLSVRRYFDRRPPEGGSIHFAKSAEDIAAHVRAADYGPFESPWGQPHVMSEAARVGLVSISVPETTAWGQAPPGTVRLSGEDAYVACADGWISLETVVVEDEVRPAASVLRDGELLTPLESPGTPT
jgi:UDP-4-amino-4-deoxy-L-arabinose formyltransferase/UDP-glucuronic acid dehydrogenase (UDP-4-keto-hexauronic acid decarboxylating)